MSWLSRRRADLLAGLGLLTRLPAGRSRRGTAGGEDESEDEIDLARSAWTWPLIGLAVGAASGGVAGLLDWAGMGRLTAAGWAMAAQVLLTGGLHEDGLADMADGFGGGRDTARKLAIMRDSRVGSYGVLALVLALLIRASALAGLAHPVTGLAVAGGLGRAAMAGLLGVLPPARRDGLAAGMTRVPPMALAAGLVVPVLAAGLTLPPSRAAGTCLAAIVAAGLVAGLARRQIGGHTGDVLGACAVIVEGSVLSVLAL